MKKILIIDDEENFLEILSEAINDEFDASIDLASKPIEALEMVQATKYDLIITDFMMPKINGGDLVKTVRLNPGPNQLTPIILLTANIQAIPVDVKSQKLVSFIDKLYYLTNLTPAIKMIWAAR